MYLLISGRGVAFWILNHLSARFGSLGSTGGQEARSKKQDAGGRGVADWLSSLDRKTPAGRQKQRRQWRHEHRGACANVAGCGAVRERLLDGRLYSMLRYPVLGVPSYVLSLGSVDGCEIDHVVLPAPSPVPRSPFPLPSFRLSILRQVVRPLLMPID